MSDLGAASAGAAEPPRSATKSWGTSLSLQPLRQSASVLGWGATSGCRDRRDEVHRAGSLNSRHMLSRSSGGQKSESKALGGLLPSKGLEGNCPTSLSWLGWLADNLGRSLACSAAPVCLHVPMVFFLFAGLSLGPNFPLFIRTLVIPRYDSSVSFFGGGTIQHP